ncbi:MAG TPA: flavodoxin domain-containing protein [Bacteroidales bacterium]|nr:flavodoxin domain-containing protein [Bacteroidales bacterium]
MDSTIVYYYSRKGSNRFLAERISKDLNCEIERIRPHLNAFFLMLFGVNFGIRKLKKKPEEYERVVLVGPIFMGKFIPPLRGFIKKYSKQIKKLTFVTCCGSTYENKNEKFGHGLVFKMIEDILADKCEHCEAFPVGLVLPEDQKNDSDAFMKTHLNENNFKGEILNRYEKFILSIRD